MCRHKSGPFIPAMMTSLNTRSKSCFVILWSALLADVSGVGASVSPFVPDSWLAKELSELGLSARSN
jgi:hypothetical protein